MSQHLDAYNHTPTLSIDPAYHTGRSVSCGLACIVRIQGIGVLQPK